MDRSDFSTDYRHQGTEDDAENGERPEDQADYFLWLHGSLVLSRHFGERDSASLVAGGCVLGRLSGLLRLRGFNFGLDDLFGHYSSSTGGAGLMNVLLRASYLSPISGYPRLAPL